MLHAGNDDCDGCDVDVDVDDYDDDDDDGGIHYYFFFQQFK
jgi:hypothetical protein